MKDRDLMVYLMKENIKLRESFGRRKKPQITGSRNIGN